MNKSATVEATGAPEAVADLSEAYQEKKFLNPEALGDTLLDRMPSPTGWRILILPYKGKGKTESGIYLNRISLLSRQGKVSFWGMVQRKRLGNFCSLFRV